MTKLRFKGTYQHPSRYLNLVNESVERYYHPIPDTIDYAGYISLDDPFDPVFKMTIGDYLIIEWRAGEVAEFNAYGKYGHRVGVKSYDNLKAEDLKADFFRHAVGHSFLPMSVADVSDAKRMSKPKKARCVKCGHFIKDDPGFTYCPKCYNAEFDKA